MIKIFLGLLFCASASAHEVNCWTREIDPSTQKIFASADVWKASIADWKKWPRVTPNGLNLMRAAETYLKYQDHVKQWGSDKAAHCFMGCKMTQETDFKTVQFLAWLKEYRDVTDCDVNSHFEEADYQSTIQGAVQGLDPAVDCENLCAPKDR